jgi:colanic acid/amylovoran biosynthesis protein
MLIPQVTGPGEFEDDRVMIRKVFEAAGKNLKDKVIVVDDDYSPFILKEIYRRLWFLVGTRLHSVIFSLSSGVPAIALSYSPHKSEGVMDMVGLSDFVFPVDDLPLDACFKAVEQIYNDRDVFASNVLLKVKERSIDSLVIAAELLNDEAIKDINHGLTYCDIEWISALKPS